MMERLRIQLLGTVIITSDNGSVSDKPFNERELRFLAYLLLRSGKPQSRKQLARDLWPESSEVQGRSNLRNLLTRLRNRAPLLTRYIEDAEQHLAWCWTLPLAFDVAEFERLLENATHAAASSDDTVTIDLLMRAVKLYNGDLMPGHEDEWILAERERLRERYYVAALAWLTDLLEMHNRLSEAIDYADRLAQADPIRETTYVTLMRLHHLNGDSAKALALYSRFSRVLRSELGVDPGPAMQAMHSQILQDIPVPSLDKSAGGVRPRSLPLVGRDSALEQLHRCWRETSLGNTQFALITGEAGIGKTRLIEEFAGWATSNDIIVLSATCLQSQEPTSYMTLANWLTDEKLWPFIDRVDDEQRAVLSVLSPRLRERYPVPLEPTWFSPVLQRARLFQSIANVLAGRREQFVLALDDIQWCDAQSVDWIQFLLDRFPHERILIVATLQTGNPHQSPVDLLEADLTIKRRLTRISLSPLSLGETRTLANSLSQRVLDGRVVERLYQKSLGIPYFIVEFAHSLRDKVEGREGGSLNLGQIPDNVAALVLRRVATLTAGIRRLLDLASVIGTGFSVSLICDVLRLHEDEVVRDLDELWRRRFIASNADGLFQISHDLVREVIYKQLSDVQRKYWHRRIAGLMVDAYPDVARSEIHVRIADHYERAGMNQKAAEQCVLAARSSINTLPSDDAVSQLRQAISLLEPLPETSEVIEQALGTWLQLGVALSRHRQFHDSDLRHAFSKAHSLSRRIANPFPRFAALRGLWEVEWQTVQMESARYLADELFDLANEIGASSLIAEAYWVRGAILCTLADYAASVPYLEQAIFYAEAGEHESLALSRTYRPIIAAKCFLSSIHVLSGRFDQGTFAMQSIVDMARQQSNPYEMLFVLAHLGIAQQMLGQVDAAMKTAAQLADLGALHRVTHSLSIAGKIRCWALLQVAPTEEIVELLSTLILNETGLTPEVDSTTFAVVLAESLVCRGEVREAQRIVDLSMDAANRSGVAVAMPDLYRVRGEVLMHQNKNDQQAEFSIRQAIALARTQGARLHELRATMTLCRFLQMHKREQEACSLLQVQLESLTEGHDTPLVRTAIELVKQLSSPV